MAGLKEAMASNGGVLPGLPAPQQPMMQGEDGEPEPNVTPEEQAEYEAIVNNAFRVIFPDGEQGAEVNPEVIASLQASDDPKLNLATTAETIMSHVDRSAQQNGKKLAGETLMSAGQDVVNTLAEIAELMKIHEYSEEEAEGAFYAAADMFRVNGEAEGRVDSETLKQEFGVLQQANEEGRLAEVLPPLADRMADMEAAGAEEEQV